MAALFGDVLGRFHAGGGGDPVMPTEYDINLMIVAVGDRYELRMQNNVAAVIITLTRQP